MYDFPHGALSPTTRRLISTIGGKIAFSICRFVANFIRCDSSSVRKTDRIGVTRQGSIGVTAARSSRKEGHERLGDNLDVHPEVPLSDVFQLESELFGPDEPRIGLVGIRNPGRLNDLSLVVELDGGPIRNARPHRQDAFFLLGTHVAEL